MPASAEDMKLETPGDDGRWFGFVRAFMLTCFGTLGGLLTIIFLLDPYDSGRAPFSLIRGTPDKDSRFSDASHGRNPKYNAAIIGNSHGQALHSERLSDLTGLSFVQMTVPGTKPREQLVLMKWFARHHTPATAKAIVLVVDDWWCTHDPALPVLYEFPFWLYEGGWLDYLPKLLTTQSFDRATRRVAMAAGWAKIVQPSGFDDYEIGTAWSFHPAPVETTPLAPAFDGAGLSRHFPAIDNLRAALAAELAGVPVIVTMPYVHISALPRPGTERAAEIANCKQAMAAVAGESASARFLDLYIDAPLAHDEKNFMDATHYRANVAMIIERRIAAALAAPR